MNRSTIITKYSREWRKAINPSQERHDGSCEENQDGHSSTSGLFMNISRPKKTVKPRTEVVFVWKRKLLAQEEQTSGETVDRNTVYSQVGK